MDQHLSNAPKFVKLGSMVWALELEMSVYLFCPTTLKVKGNLHSLEMGRIPNLMEALSIFLK